MTGVRRAGEGRFRRGLSERKGGGLWMGQISDPNATAAGLSAAAGGVQSDEGEHQADQQDAAAIGQMSEKGMGCRMKHFRLRSCSDD